MTGSTVVVDTASQFAVRNTIAISIGLMLVFVMAEVLRACVCFVLATASYCRPGELEGQENEQEDGKPAAHGANSISQYESKKRNPKLLRGFVGWANGAKLFESTS